MRSEIITITPELANEYLRHNIDNNRRINPKTVKMYAEDMKAGRWQLTSQGITFNENGDLVDGQHRLKAVIMSGANVDMYVTFDLPRESTLFDRGKIRSAIDSLTMLGVAGNSINSSTVGAVRYLFSRVGAETNSYLAIGEFMTSNYNIIDEAYRAVCIGGSRLCKKSPVIAGVICALYHGVPNAEIRKFCEIANSGFCDSPDRTSAIVLRNRLLNYRSSTVENDSVFVITNCAIKDFVDGKRRRVEYAAGNEPVYFDETIKTYIQRLAEAKHE